MYPYWSHYLRELLKNSITELLNLSDISYKTHHALFSVSGTSPDQTYLFDIMLFWVIYARTSRPVKSSDRRADPYLRQTDRICTHCFSQPTCHMSRLLIVFCDVWHLHFVTVLLCSTSWLVSSYCTIAKIQLFSLKTSPSWSLVSTATSPLDVELELPRTEWAHYNKYTRYTSARLQKKNSCMYVVRWVFRLLMDSQGTKSKIQ